MKKQRERINLDYKNNSEKYFIKSEDLANDCFERQFYFFYRGRILELTERIKINGLKKLGPNGKLSQLADVTHSGEDYFVIGVILKKMKYRQSILYEFTDEETLDLEFREKLRSDNLVSEDDFLEFEDDQQELNIILNIDRLIIAGDSIRITSEEVDKKRIDEAITEIDVDKDSINQFDKILIDIMPGSNDPISILLPQQPIPRMIFNYSKRFGKMLNCVTNPYNFSLSGLNFLGTAGQNIKDLAKHTSGFSNLDLMEQCLERSHIFPTVPDSIDGFPFQLRDPLILEEMPHVFFVGNHKALEHRLYERSDGAKTFLLTIPDFSITQSVALLNLRNLDVIEYEFNLKNDFYCM